jgi:hypothetical protein
MDTDKVSKYCAERDNEKKRERYQTPADQKDLFVIRGRGVLHSLRPFSPFLGSLNLEAECRPLLVIPDIPVVWTEDPPYFLAIVLSFPDFFLSLFITDGTKCHAITLLSAPVWCLPASYMFYYSEIYTKIMPEDRLMVMLSI